MILYNLKEKPEYIRDLVLICHAEWGDFWSDEETEKKLQEKINSTVKRIERYPTLILLDDNKLAGFVSLFESDCEERTDLTPWYATLYVKEEYRGRGLSKQLNDAIISEAKQRGYEKLYLKTDLVNFYEKYGFNHLEKKANGDSIYYMGLK